MPHPFLSRCRWRWGVAKAGPRPYNKTPAPAPKDAPSLDWARTLCVSVRAACCVLRVDASRFGMAAVWRVGSVRFGVWVLSRVLCGMVCRCVQTRALYCLRSGISVIWPCCCNCWRVLHSVLRCFAFRNGHVAVCWLGVWPLAVARCRRVARVACPVCALAYALRVPV